MDVNVEIVKQIKSRLLQIYNSILLKPLVTDEELKEITAELFKLIESPPVLDLNMDFQGETQFGSTADKAPAK